MIDLSIIIPCFNHGSYIREAINSVLDIEIISYEIIVVNDGSTDEFTIQILLELENEGFKVINQSNLGLAAARNSGISRSKGRFILPLDADNKIVPESIPYQINILNNGDADIIYGNPIFFGELNDIRIFKPTKFDILRIFNGNYIDACAIYRKSVWEVNLGYDTNMKFGHEDWEFWINSYKNGFKFLYINKDFFYYRVLEGSMIVNSNRLNRHSLNRKFIISKHLDLYISLYQDLFRFRNRILSWKNTPFKNVVKSVLKLLK